MNNVISVTATGYSAGCTASSPVTATNDFSSFGNSYQKVTLVYTFANPLPTGSVAIAMVYNGQNVQASFNAGSGYNAYSWSGSGPCSMNQSFYISSASVSGNQLSVELTSCNGNCFNFNGTLTGNLIDVNSSMMYALYNLNIGSSRSISSFYDYALCS